MHPFTQTEATDTDAMVRILHPDWTDEQIQGEVDHIREETGTAVPDPVQAGALDQLPSPEDHGQEPFCSRPHLRFRVRHSYGEQHRNESEKGGRNGCDLRTSIHARERTRCLAFTNLPLCARYV